MTLSERDRLLKQWDKLYIRVTGEYNLKKFHTYGKALQLTGITKEEVEEYFPSRQTESTISFGELRELLKCCRLRIIQAYESQEAKASNYIQQAYEYEGYAECKSSNDNSDERSKILQVYYPTKEEKQQQEEAEYIPEDSYQIPDFPSFNKSPNEKATLFNFQKITCQDILKHSTKLDQHGMLLLAAAGLGKTYMYGAWLRRIIDSGFLEGKTFSPWPIIVITRASIVTQTERVLREQFCLDTIGTVLVINIEQMRSKFGEMFVKEDCRIENGEEIIKFFWKKNVFPAIIILDECQSVKNITSIQSRIIQSYNEIPSPNIWQLYVSATPFTRVCEAKAFTVACKIKSRYGGHVIGKEVLITNENWKIFADNISSDMGRVETKPIDYSPSAVERLMKELTPYVIDVKGVRSQFKPINRVEIVRFESQEDRAFYDNAWNRWLRDKTRLEKEAEATGKPSGMAILAAFTKFRQAAELCRAKILARRAYHKMQEGFAPIIAVCFKTTLVRIVQVLCTEYHIHRNKISLIWGGKSQTKSKALAKKALREKLSQHKDFLEELSAAGTSLEEMGLNASDIAELMDEEAERINKELAGKDLDLGIQNKKSRQENIDRFQKQETDICIFTFKAGGVGLSLHHCDEMTKEKARRKEDSNWAFVEDIPLIPTKPRSTDLTPTYSAIEMVQGLGRPARLTSLSNTPQSMLFFSDTIEEQVAASVSRKLKCLKKVVRQKEHWEDIIIGGSRRLDKEEIEQPSLEDDADDYLVGGGASEDEEDEEE